MTVQVTQYQNSPILMAIFEGAFGLSSVRHFSRQSSALQQELGYPVMWRLVDLSQAQVTFSEVMMVLKYIEPNEPGCLADPTLKTVFCPPHPMARLISQMMAKEQYGNVSLPVFPGLGEALLYIQDEIHGGFGAGV